MEFRALYEHAHRGQLHAHDPGRIKVDGWRLGGREHCDSQLSALERVTRLRAELGEGTFGLIVAVAVDERSWVSLARRCGGMHRSRRWLCWQAAGDPTQPPRCVNYESYTQLLAGPRIECLRADRVARPARRRSTGPVSCPSPYPSVSPIAIRRPERYRSRCSGFR